MNQILVSDDFTNGNGKAYTLASKPWTNLQATRVDIDSGLYTNPVGMASVSTKTDEPISVPRKSVSLTALARRRSKGVDFVRTIYRADLQEQLSMKVNTSVFNTSNLKTRHMPSSLPTPLNGLV